MESVALLHEASMDELLDELKRRATAVVVSIAIPHAACEPDDPQRGRNGDLEAMLTYRKGSLPACYGLAVRLQELVRVDLLASASDDAETEV